MAAYGHHSERPVFQLARAVNHSSADQARCARNTGAVNGALRRLANTGSGLLLHTSHCSSREPIGLIPILRMLLAIGWAAPFCLPRNPHQHGPVPAPLQYLPQDLRYAAWYLTPNPMNVTMEKRVEKMEQVSSNGKEQGCIKCQISITPVNLSPEPHTPSLSRISHEYHPPCPKSRALPWLIQRSPSLAPRLTGNSSPAQGTRAMGGGS